MQIVNSEINSKLRKTDTMENNSNNSTKPGSSAATTTQLPGVNTSQVISSSPKLIKENSQFFSTKKK